MGLRTHLPTLLCHLLPAPEEALPQLGPATVGSEQKLLPHAYLDQRISSGSTHSVDSFTATVAQPALAPD